jgi:hypothetical protein
MNSFKSAAVIGLIVVLMMAGFDRSPQGSMMRSILIGASSSARLTHSASQEPCAEDHRAWVTDTLKKMQIIKPGMTRGQLLKVFTTEGGTSTGLQRTFVSRDCPYFKVYVTFEAVGRASHDNDGRVTLAEDSRDIIATVSRPYLQFSIVD